MSFGFHASTNKVLGHTDVRSRSCQILIQRCCPLAFSKAQLHSVREKVDDAQGEVRPCMVRCEGKGLGCSRLGCLPTCSFVISKRANDALMVSKCATDQRLDAARIKQQGTRKKAARLRIVFWIDPLVQKSPTLEIQVHRIGMCGTLRAARFDSNELSLEDVGKQRDDFILHLEQSAMDFSNRSAQR